MVRLRVIGDVHGHYKQYMDIINDVPYSVQLGDFGFDYSCMNGVSLNHAILLGNHEAYDVAFDCPNVLPSFGMNKVGPFEFFGVRGGFSIDKPQRIEYNRVTGKKVWWPNEQLNEREREACLRQYEMAKPSVVFSHSCPASISEIVGKPGVLAAFGWPEDMVTPTQQLLQDMLEVHEPDLWVFGHYHRDWFYTTKNTDFICLNELEYIDFDEDWRIL